MNLSLNEAKKKFQEVISGSLSREDADRWAYSIIQKSEAGEIHFVPPENEKIIMKGIMFLYGIDLKEKKDEYLHTIEDIIEVLENGLGG